MREQAIKWMVAPLSEDCDSVPPQSKWERLTVGRQFIYEARRSLPCPDCPLVSIESYVLDSS
jgi:hypothetical protein